MGLHSLALTNTPAIEHMTPIVNSDLFEGGQHIMDIQKLAELLGLGTDATEEQILESLKACVDENKSLKAGAQPPADDSVVANKTVCELVGLEAGAPVADVTARIMELKSGKIDGVDLKAEIQTLKQQAAARDADAAVTLALKAGKIAPAQKDWARQYALDNPQGFAAFVEKAPQVVPMGELLGDGTMALKGGTLDEATMLVCKQLGLDPEDVKKYNLKEE